MADSKINTTMPPAHTTKLLSSNSIEFAEPNHYEDGDDEDVSVRMNHLNKLCQQFPKSSPDSVIYVL